MAVQSTSHPFEQWQCYIEAMLDSESGIGNALMPHNNLYTHKHTNHTKTHMKPFEEYTVLH